VVPVEHRRHPNENDLRDARVINRLARDFTQAYEDYLTLCRTTLFS
jgi:hypothetical protein